MADVALAAKGASSDPLTYVIPGAQEILIKAARASFDGSAASGSFVPALRILDPNGNELAACPISDTLTVGASADVSWFPRGGVSKSSGGAGTKAVPIWLDTPDVNGNGFTALSTTYGFTNVRRACPALDHTPATVSTWQGTIIVPDDYASGAKVQLTMVADNALANKAARITVGSNPVAIGGSENTAFTLEAYVNVAVPATANLEFQQSYTLSTTPVAGGTLNVQVLRDPTNIGDTLTSTPVLIWKCAFIYTSS